MGEPLKGTVTPLSSVFAPEEAQKASVRVQETISERRKQVDQLQAFLNDNNGLVNLVKKLPDQLHHDIMVPFGKAAFFPGRLIHTNEFLVLLGEGYYAERTSKQTIEILKRRGKDLESQIETLNAVIKDLKFEASFFDDTAIEAAEGIVEIREDYVDEAFNEDEPTKGEDDFARILSRIDELEKEELESEIAEEHEEEDKADLSHLISLTSLEPEGRSPEEQAKNEHLMSKISLQNHPQEDVPKPVKPKDLPARPVSKDSDLSSHVKVPTSSGSRLPPSLVEHNKLKERVSHTPVPKNEVSTSASNSGNHSSRASVVAPVSKEVSDFDSSIGSDRSKAFTGSIVEHTHNIENNNQKGQMQAPASKPVSRFKMQRK
ncbi:RNA polymerase II subunit 5-mediating protein homolog isoform X2 [Cynara cardunculus var. scolymus]|uniref:RNA polymerase II subunit 5-mediating protein homolog isoform X2 n=1 Tax=Cynara cardunculus var. scolymus TaxID=59895 RepID=UPI000D62BF41|nr:RNA polymerase II subunit 5-mediating protein homolog isoform X2 [Cynara cardunculus var. scolymus]